MTTIIIIKNRKTKTLSERFFGAVIRDQKKSKLLKLSHSIEIKSQTKHCSEQY